VRIENNTIINSQISTIMHVSAWNGTISQIVVINSSGSTSKIPLLLSFLFL